MFNTVSSLGLIKLILENIVDVLLIVTLILGDIYLIKKIKSIRN